MHLVKLFKNEGKRLLDAPIGIFFDGIAANTDIANGHRHEKFPTLRLLAERFMGALTKHGKFHLAHGAFHAKQQPVVGAAGIINALFIDN